MSKKRKLGNDAYAKHLRDYTRKTLATAQRRFSRLDRDLLSLEGLHREGEPGHGRARRAMKAVRRARTELWTFAEEVGV